MGNRPRHDLTPSRAAGAGCSSFLSASKITGHWCGRSSGEWARAPRYTAKSGIRQRADRRGLLGSRRIAERWVGGDIFDQLADIDAPAVADTNSALKVLLFALDTLALVIPVTSGSVDLVIEGTDKLADEIRGHQLMSESFDN